MYDASKKTIESDKANSSNSYNLNSFRGLSHHNSERSKPEGKIISPRVIDKKEKEKEVETLKANKPILLTGRLPKAFDYRFGR
jgi:hypothetical protein